MKVKVAQSLSKEDSFVVAKGLGVE